MGSCCVADLIPFERGVIHHRERAQQIVDFSGLCFGTITPTDIDGLIEYRNRCFLFVEFKHVSKPEIDDGQRLALERMARGLRKPTFVLHAVHNVPSHVDIDAAGALVHRLYLNWKPEWRPPDRLITVREAAEWFFEAKGSPRI